MNTDINPDEAVAHGAAVQGAILSGQSNSQVQGAILSGQSNLQVTHSTWGSGTGGYTERSEQFTGNTQYNLHRSLPLNLYSVRQLIILWTLSFTNHLKRICWVFRFCH